MAVGDNNHTRDGQHEARSWGHLTIEERQTKSMVEKPNVRFRAVVFATDFSPTSANAGRYAVLYAQHYGARLIAVHAFDLDQSARAAEALRHAPSVQRERLQHELQEFVKGITHGPIEVTQLVQEGTPGHVLAELSRQDRPNLIVLGTHGGSRLHHHLVGSVAEAVLREVPSPVLTLGPHVGPPTDSSLNLRRILYATDFSPAASNAACYAFDLAQSFDSELDVLHVVSDGNMAHPEMLGKKEKAFFEELEKLAPQGGRELYHSRTFVEGGNVAERILRHASERAADLIVLGAHHHSWVSMHVRTGPAFAVIVGAACPVLTLSAG